MSAHDRRQRRILIGVALMFFAPPAVSFYLYYGKFWHPGGRVNAGELIDPARPLPALALPLASPATGGATQTNPQFLKGKWTFLYLQHGRCDDECGKHLYDTRQVRLALDREMNRVQRVFIGDSDCCDLKELLAAHPDLIAVRSSAADEPLMALLPERSGAKRLVRRLPHAEACAGRGLRTRYAGCNSPARDGQVPNRHRRTRRL